MSYPLFIIHGTPGNTQTQQTTNTASSLEDLGFTLEENNRYPSGALISVEVNNIRIAFGDNSPTQGGSGHLLQSGDSLRLTHRHEVESIEFISASFDSPADIQFTPLYGQGN